MWRAYALGIITGSFITAAALVAAPAKSEPVGDAVIAYVATFGGSLCAALNEQPTFDMLTNAFQVIVADGLSWRQAAQVVILSVQEICPQHQSLLSRYAASGRSYA